MPFFFLDYNSYKVGKTKVANLNIIQTGCFPSVLNNNNIKIFPSKIQFYTFCLLFSVWIHSWFEV